MNKLNYEEWKKNYCSEISKDNIKNLKTLHNIEDPLDLIEKERLKAYNQYIEGYYYKENS